MSSAFDDLYIGGAEMLMQYFADETTVEYVDGAGTSSTVSVILGHIQVTEVETDDGTIRKEYRRSLHVQNNAADMLWGGVPDAQLRGHFVIDGWQWRIEDREQQGIEGKSPTFTTCSLVRKRPTNDARTNLRRYT